MRYLFTLACLLLVTATVADEPEFDFSSVGAKKAFRDYNKAVAKDKADAAKLAQKRRDAFVESLERALKQSMQAGNLDEANKIDAAIKALEKGVSKALEKGVSPPGANGLLKDLVGTWRFFGTTTITFHRNGTVTGSWGGNGRWEIEKRRVVIIWDATSRGSHPEWHSFDFPIDPKGVSGDGWGGPGYGGSLGKLK